MLLGGINITTEVEKRDRNWLIRIYSELERNGDVGIECHREIILIKDGKKWDTAGGNGEHKYTVSKLLSDIMYDTITLPEPYGGYTLTAGQIALALEMLSDKYSKSVLKDVRVETAADGSGSVVGPQELSSGSTLTVYAISRDSVGNFVANVAADSWALINKTGDVVDGDLVAAGDRKSATLTGALAGTAEIEATSGNPGSASSIPSPWHRASWNSRRTSTPRADDSSPIRIRYSFYGLHYHVSVACG